MRFGKIQYLNLLPFDVFLKSYPTATRIKSAAFANRSYPSKLNQSFLFRRIDAGFISTIAGYHAHRRRRATQAGICAKGAVWSVLNLNPPSEAQDRSETQAREKVARKGGAERGANRERGAHTAQALESNYLESSRLDSRTPSLSPPSHFPPSLVPSCHSPARAPAAHITRPRARPTHKDPRLDSQSDTSNALSIVLGLQGFVLIGDKALQYRFAKGKDKHSPTTEAGFIDMGAAWWERHRLPFVFGRLCYNGYGELYHKIARAFLRKQVKIPRYILAARSLEYQLPLEYVRAYLSHIYYHIRAREQRAMERFYRAARLESIKLPRRIYPRNVDSHKLAENHTTYIRGARV